MNEVFFDLRFAICDLMRRPTGSRRFTDSSLEPTTVSLTPRFSGVLQLFRSRNRFSGFHCRMPTAKAVPVVDQRVTTPLKRGFNEKGRSGAPSQSQIANRKSPIQWT